MTREEKIVILKDIIDGEIIHPQVRRDVGIWAIKALEQEPKTGHWIAKRIGIIDRELYCDQCGEEALAEYPSRFCSNCGAKMIGDIKDIEPQERSDKE